MCDSFGIGRTREYAEGSIDSTQPTPRPQGHQAVGRASFPSPAVCGVADKKDSSADSDTTVYLFVQSEKGWFASDVGTKIANGQTDTFTDFIVRELRRTATAAGALRVFLRFAENGGHDVGEGSDSWVNEKLVIAGLGASGLPHATPPLLLRTVATEDPGAEEEAAKPTVTTTKLEANLLGDELELIPASPAKSLAKAHLAPTGKHTLVFP